MRSKAGFCSSNGECRSQLGRKDSPSSGRELNYTQTWHRCTPAHLLTLFPVLSCALDHPSNKKRVAFDTFSFSLFCYYSPFLSFSLALIISFSLVLWLSFSIAHFISFSLSLTVRPATSLSICVWRSTSCGFRFLAFRRHYCCVAAWSEKPLSTR